MIRTVNRVALYARFSSDNQRTESIDAQIRAMTAYCQDHNFVIVKTYIDEARSATTDRRPSFQQMIADSANRTFDVLLVHKLDRFSRNRYDSAIYKRELRKNGVSVYSVLENLDNSPESVIMESVLEGMSEYYSQNLAREVMKGMRETALQCKHTGGKPPLGYDIDPETKKLVINSQEAETVRLIYEMYSNGQGYSAILKRLHEEGRKTKNGNDFQKNSLYSILTNGKYQGTYIYNRSAAKSGLGTRNTHQSKSAEDIIAVDGGCPQIVDSDTFIKVQKRIAGNRHAGGRGNAKNHYLLSGKVYCKECGRAMVGNTRRSGRNKEIYITYRCPSKRYACSNREINQRYLDEYVVTALEEHMLNAKALRRIAKRIEKHNSTVQAVCQPTVEELQAQLVEVTTALSNVADAVESGLLSDALVARLHELEARKIELETALQTTSVAPANTVVDPAVILSEYQAVRGLPAAPAYKAFVCTCVDRIEVGRYAVDVTLKTGLGVSASLDTTLTARREDIYKRRAS